MSDGAERRRRDAETSRLPPRRALRVAAAVGLTLLAFVWLDRAIGGVEGGGPYRAEIRRAIEDVQRAPRADHAVFGCSTSSWFPRALTRAWQLDPSAVVDAHMSDCLQACTMAQARRIHHLGRHFQTATFGINTFEYCEKYRERRSMQEVELLPPSDSAELAALYWHSEDPFSYAGGWFMNHVSRVYGNTMWLQRHFRKSWFGNESLDGTWYVSATKSERGRRSSSKAFRCDYAKADRAFGLAATRAALKALELVADRVHLVLLPDRNYADGSPETRRVEDLFLAEHRQLADEFSRVELVDIQGGKLDEKSLFRDNAHLNQKGIQLASKLLARRLPRPPTKLQEKLPTPQHHEARAPEGP